MPKIKIPPQTQVKPGKESEMYPEPVSENPDYKSAGKFVNKVVLINGGDSGIGKATAIAFAKEGAEIAIVHRQTTEDAEKTRLRIIELGKKCLVLKGDVGGELFCHEVVKKCINKFGKLDILINNAAEQHPTENFREITAEQIQSTFKTNIFSMFFMSQAALPYLERGASIINTTSVTAYQGRSGLIDYSATKGAIVSFTRSLSQNLAKKGIRVNAIAPGPIWTPLIPSTFDAKKVSEFGSDTPMGRAGQPFEVAAGFIFLASSDASYITGQTLHINGGYAVNG